jgi:hypothetical protein
MTPDQVKRLQSLEQICRAVALEVQDDCPTEAAAEFANADALAAALAELTILQGSLDLACRCLRGQTAAMQEAGDAVAYVESMLAAGRLAEAEGTLDECDT